MVQPSTRSAPRFHSRIFGIGALATLLLFVIGAPIFNNRIEDDLERRVPAELAKAGFAGVAASFSGQDGTLGCATPLDDPERATAAAYDVHGVRAIELDRSCRVTSATGDESTTATAAGNDGAASDDTDLADDGEGAAPDDTVQVVEGDSDDAATETTVDSLSETALVPDFATVADVVASSPQLSLMAELVGESGLADLIGVGAPGPITLFAPTDEAFDTLAADALAKLRDDTELLRQVLSHHAVAGASLVSDLVDGSLDTLGGGSIEIATADAQVTVSGASIITPDLTAANGIVHVIDQVLVPDDVDLSTPGPLGEVSAVFQDGGVTLTGVVGSEVERAVLTAAVSTASESLTVDDQLTIDPEIGIDPATTSSLAQLVAAMPVHLINGVSGFDSTALYVGGTYAGDADRDAMLAVAAAVAATTDLEPQPEATETDAVDLETELNAFVAENPLLFEQSSAVLTESSVAVLDRLALEVQQFAGVAITVEGHTDSDGDPAENLALSRFRALVVRQGLIERGIPEGSITAQGFGSEQPVLVDGVEEKPASRRVEFRVVTTP